MYTKFHSSAKRKIIQIATPTPDPLSGTSFINCFSL